MLSRLLDDRRLLLDEVVSGLRGPQRGDGEADPECDRSEGDQRSEVSPHALGPARGRAKQEEQGAREQAEADGSKHRCVDQPCVVGVRERELVGIRIAIGKGEAHSLKHDRGGHDEGAGERGNAGLSQPAILVGEQLLFARE